MCINKFLLIFKIYLPVYRILMFYFRAQQANLQKNRKRRIAKRQVYSNDNTYTGTEDVDIDTYSTAGTDIGDDEFFDCSDDELAAEDNGLVNF